MIFYKNGLSDNMNSAVFLGLQGGRHNNVIAAIATQLKEVISPEYKLYMQQVWLNAQTLANELMKWGYNICTNGTDNHIILVDLRKHDISGKKIEKICEFVNISINKKFCCR